ncbi:MAG TPA: TonB-dependent receptor, partial [Bacteroidia bacterium]|nr:TonB-dependent receptor [Bacteroidia bacterium]
TGTPVMLAMVGIENSTIGTTTDENGSFHLDNVPSGEQTIIVQLLGYKKFTQQIIIKANETTEINIVLSTDRNILKVVDITGIVSISGMGNLGEVHDGIIYSGKKTEVLILDSLDANTAQNNPRQVLGRVPGANYSETEGGGFPSNGIAFRGLNPVQSIETNTRQNGYNVTADLYGYPESYYLPPLEAVERIEVTRGASSLQFGPQFGGVINYIIKSGNPNKPFEFTTQQTGGSFGLYNSFNAAGGTYKKWNYYSYVQCKTISGWRPNSQLKQVLGFARVEYNATAKFKIGLEYSLLRNRIQMSGGLDDVEFAADARQSFRARNWLSSPWNILAFTAQYKFSEKTLLTFKSSLNISERNLVWRNEDGGIETPDSISPVTNTYVAREVEHEGFKSVTNELRFLTNYKLCGVNQTLAAGVRCFTGVMKRQGGGPGSTGSDFDMNLYGGGFEYDLDFRTNNVAVFIENTFRIGNRLSITPGFRYEYLNSNAEGYITDENDSVLNVNRSQKR